MKGLKGSEFGTTILIMNQIENVLNFLLTSAPSYCTIMNVIREYVFKKLNSILEVL